MIGRVVSVKMAKTAAVLIESNKKHALYGKMYVHTKKYLADDPIGVKLGDLVDIIKIRPISKRKHWQITKVVGKDVIALGTEALKLSAAEAIEEVLPVEDTGESVDQSVSESVSEAPASAVESKENIKNTETTDTPKHRPTAKKESK